MQEKKKTNFIQFHSNCRQFVRFKYMNICMMMMMSDNFDGENTEDIFYLSTTYY